MRKNESLDEFNMFGKCAKLKIWLRGMRKAASRWEDDYARRLVNDGFQLQRSSTISRLTCVSLCMATFSLYFRSRGVGAEEDALEDVRMVRRQVACILGSGIVTCARLRWKKFEVDRGRAGVRGE